MPGDRQADRRGERDRDRRGGRSHSGRRERREDRHEDRRDRDRDRDRDRRERDDRREDREDRDRRERGRREPEAEERSEARGAPAESRVERHVIGVQGGVACHVLHRAKPSETAGGRKNIDKFLEEIKNKHTSTELATQQRQIHVRAPERLLRQVIDVLARYVARYGEEFEEAVRADVGKHRHEIAESLGEARDIDFGFLGEKADSQEAQYYRWKAFTLAQGDGARHWRSEPFQMCQDGTIWHPPADELSEPSASRSHSRSGSNSRGRSRTKSRSKSRKKRHHLWSQSRSVERKTRRKHQERRSGLGQPAGSGRLGRRERKELARLLLALTTRSAPLLEAMCWCLDKAECAVQIARELVEALLEVELTLMERVLRLFLVSDVVHNSGSVFAMANAWCYRREFEAQLPEAFEALHAAYRGEESRLTAEKAGDQVSRVLKSWQVRAVFSPQFIKGLEVSFFRDIVSADAIAAPGGGRAGGLPEAIFVKLAEWRSQHFSQLEKLAKARGLNWQTMHIERPEDGRSLEQVRKAWLLDRLVTYELHVWETRQAPTAPPTKTTPVNLPAGTTSAIVVLSGSSKDQTSKTQVPAKPILKASGPDESGDIDDDLIDEDIDGDPLTSGDEALMAEQVPVAVPQEDERRRLAAAAAAAGARSSGRGGGRTAARAASPPASSPEGDEELDGVPVPAAQSPPDDSESKDEDDDEEEGSDVDGVPVKTEDLGKFRRGSVKLAAID